MIASNSWLNRHLQLISLTSRRVSYYRSEESNELIYGKGNNGFKIEICNILAMVYKRNTITYCFGFVFSGDRFTGIIISRRTGITYNRQKVVKYIISFFFLLITEDWNKAPSSNIETENYATNCLFNRITLVFCGNKIICVLSNQNQLAELV